MTAIAFPIPDDVIAIADGIEVFLRREVFPRHQSDHTLLSDPRRKYTEDGRSVPAVVDHIRGVRIAAAKAGYYSISVLATMRMKGKVGIVTAAASGMGRAGAVRLAREGAAVAVVDRDEAGVAATVAQIVSREFGFLWKIVRRVLRVVFENKDPGDLSALANAEALDSLCEKLGNA